MADGTATVAAAANDAETLFRGFPAIVRYRFQFRSQESIPLPAYGGSLWRGLLGHGLRGTVCVTRQKTCSGCLLVSNCVYSTLFETPAPEPGVAPRYAVLPHPFVLEAGISGDRVVPPGEPFGFTLALIGAARSHIPYLIHGMNEAGRLGIGRGAHRFSVHALEQERHLGSDRWETVYESPAGRYLPLPGGENRIPPAPERALLALKTPLRIKRQGHLVGPAELSAEDLVRQLVWRLESLQRFHGQSPAAAELRERVDTAGYPRIEARRLKWHDWTRYSSRQQTPMQMGGVVGELVLGGEALVPLWPLLWLGQWVHLGKATSMGLGQYRIGDAASLPTLTPSAG